MLQVVPHWLVHVRFGRCCEHLPADHVHRCVVVTARLDAGPVQSVSARDRSGNILVDVLRSDSREGTRPTPHRVSDDYGVLPLGVGALLVSES